MRVRLSHPVWGVAARADFYAKNAARSTLPALLPLPPLLKMTSENRTAQGPPCQVDRRHRRRPERPRKGVAAASIGNLLASRYCVIPVKCDGYLNVDPGTMNPIEHGEVFVLDDGGEVDMTSAIIRALLNVSCKFDWNLTMGKVYRACRRKSAAATTSARPCSYSASQDMIKEWWQRIARLEGADVMLVEIGGTVGDIENELYIEAGAR